MMRTLTAICGVGIVGIAALILTASLTLGKTSLVEHLARAAEANDSEDAAGPAALVRKAARKFLDDLQAHREEYRADPKQLRAAIDQDVMPFFDMQRAARLVLGRHWRQATASQRSHFIDAFENSMLRNYSNALIDFRSDRLEVLPGHLDPGATFAIVRTRITRNDGSTVSVNYAMRKSNAGWKAWDVIIEGISYVKSFRDDIGAEVDQTGLDATIRRLEGH